MTVTGIIAEFNPFHNGHKYLLDQSSGLKIIAMSGNFVQRGTGFHPPAADCRTGKYLPRRSKVQGLLSIGSSGRFGKSADQKRGLRSFYEATSGPGWLSFFSSDSSNFLTKSFMRLNVSWLMTCSTRQASFVAFGSETPSILKHRDSVVCRS